LLEFSRRRYRGTSLIRNQLTAEMLEQTYKVADKGKEWRWPFLSVDRLCVSPHPQPSTLNPAP